VQKTLLFYDLETTGLDKSYDQVQQFAAIRTDLDLNELERHEIFVKINPDIIPSPEALLVHRVSISQCNEIGLNEYEAMQKIHALLNTPNTISIGYNTLGFDDEFLRFSFHRNLLTPYTHQFANGCGRADLYPMAAMLRWQEADCISWPKIDGKPTLKLEHISATNQLAQGQAHNALVDVEATIALSKRFQSSESSWQYLLGYFDKHQESKRFTKLEKFSPAPSFQLAIMLDGQFGSQRLYQCPVLGLGAHKHYRNQTLWLKCDQEDLIELNEKNLDTLPWIIRKKSGESPFFLPNKPRFMNRLSKTQSETLARNLNFLSERPALLKKIQAYHSEWQYPELPELPAQAGLYQSDFLSATDLRQCAAFHEAKPSQKAVIADKFRRPNLKNLADNILAKHYPEIASDEQNQNLQNQISKYMQNEPMLNHQGKPRRTLSDLQEALIECQAKDLDASQCSLLEELNTTITETIASKPTHLA